MYHRHVTGQDKYYRNIIEVLEDEYEKKTPYKVKKTHFECQTQTGKLSQEYYRATISDSFFKKEP